MAVKQAETAVPDAEKVLQKAKAAVFKAVRRENAHTARIQEQSRKKADLVASLERMLDPEFPSEMMLSVPEAAIRSERLQWCATEPESLTAAVEDFLPGHLILTPTCASNSKEQ